MRARGYSLIEMLCALVVLALLALLSFRGLGAVLDAREQVGLETAKWKAVSAFFSRFQYDVQLSAPRPVRAEAHRFEASRLAPADGVAAPRRVAYVLNDNREVELWLWPALDAPPVRHVVLTAVAQFELRYLDRALAWVDAWPSSEREPLPRALRLRIVLASGEELVRVFPLR
jgi:general secretion pathway protein J